MQTDLWLFIETILSIRGVHEVGSPLTGDGISVRFFTGLTGRKVMIDCSDDSILYKNCKRPFGSIGL